MSIMRILISNLNSLTTSVHLQTLFSHFGKVLSAGIIRQAETGKSLSMGYVEMLKKPGAQAVYALHGYQFMNYFIDVEETL
jgi:RNA recognition motif-containing protein